MNSISYRSTDIVVEPIKHSPNDINEWSLQGSRRSYKHMKWKWSKVIHAVFADYLPLYNKKLWR